MHPLAESQLWLVPLHVRSGSEPIPAPMTGAYVTVFCGAPDATVAAWTAIQAIEAMGYSVPENPTEVQMMPASAYEQFVADQWPDLVSELPDQSELYERLSDSRLVIGPFAAYEG